MADHMSVRWINDLWHRVALTNVKIHSSLSIQRNFCPGPGEQISVESRFVPDIWFVNSVFASQSQAGHNVLLKNFSHLLLALGTEPHYITDELSEQCVLNRD